MDEIAADPKVRSRCDHRGRPELASDREAQAAILDATIATWRDPTGARPLGAIDRAGWDASIAYLTGLGMVPNPVKLEDVIRDDLLPAR